MGGGQVRGTVIHNPSSDVPRMLCPETSAELVLLCLQCFFMFQKAKFFHQTLNYSDSEPPGGDKYGFGQMLVIVSYSGFSKIREF